MLITAGSYTPPTKDDHAQIVIKALWNDQTLPLSFDVIEGDDGPQFYLLASHPHNTNLMVGVDMEEMQALKDQLHLRLPDIKASYVNRRPIS